MRRQQWDPAVVVDEDLARTLISATFPDVPTDSLTFVGAGWDNTAWRAGDLVFRFPRRGIARALMHTETSVLPQIASALSLPISAPTHIAEPTDAYPYPWAGYPWMSGTTGCQTEHIDTTASAQDLGRFLRALHSLDVTVPGDDWRANIPLQANKLVRVLTNLSTETLAERDAALDLVDVLRHTPLHAGPDVLCHGDLYARHVLFADGRPCGVIDWGDVHRGDPATDLAVAFMLFEPVDRAPFRTAYGTIDPDTWQRARFRALFSGVYQLHYASSVGDVALQRAGRAAVRRALHQ